MLLTVTVPLPPHKPGPGLMIVTVAFTLCEGASLQVLGPVAVKLAVTPVKVPT
jgi:hypothetical protein